MATVATPRFTRLSSESRRAQILASARRLFSERHYSAVSTAEIVSEAGVTRGLLHHYFGTKRELYLEVVRSLISPPELSLGAAEGRPGREGALVDAVDRWLDMVERNRETWLSTVGAPGFGRDPDVEAIYDEALELTIDRVIALFRPGDPREAPPELRALVRAYGALAEGASVEWVQRARLTREQTRILLVDTLHHLVRETAPRMAAGSDGASGTGRVERLATAVRRTIGREDG